MCSVAQPVFYPQADDILWAAPGSAEDDDIPLQALELVHDPDHHYTAAKVLQSHPPCPPPWDG